MASLWKLVNDAIPDDHAEQFSAYDLARREMARPDAPGVVLDVGCGDAKSAAVFREVKPDVRWIGLDVGDSPLARAVRDEQVLLYDGEHMPLATGSIPLMYSRQVFEHVRYPELLLAEIARVLAPGGSFIGSTSHLEPYHAYSLWNYTPYGFKVLVKAAGLKLVELRPGLDGQALVRRTYGGFRPEDSRWFGEASPLNVEIDSWGRDADKRPALVNARKLEVCGHFCFVVIKPVDWRPPQAVVAQPSWDDVRADGRKALTAAVRLTVEAVAGARASAVAHPRLRRGLRRVPGARWLVRTLRQQRKARRGR